VPVFNSLDKVYTDTNNSIKEVHEPRFKRLKERFKAQYGCLPQFYARAPGRVNIIGEHIDYCGYSVLPAALEQDFLMAYVTVEDGEGADKICVANIDKDSYPPETISNDPFQKLVEHGHMLNYFLCGYKAILAHDEEVRKHVTGKYKGLKILIDSVVPPAAGLSSSSAFTVCAAVTTMHAYGLTGVIT
jgi:galactokinase